MQALEYRFRVESNVDGLCRYLDTVLRPLSAPAPAVHHSYELMDRGEGSIEVTLDGATIAACHEMALAVEWLLWHVNQSAASSVPGRVALHAGGVQAGDVGVVLPGPSGAGKSSVVAALVESGFGYLSDELVVLEGDGERIRGYPKPLTLRGGAQAALARWRPPEHDISAALEGTWLVDPDQVRPGSLGDPCQPAFVVAPRFVPGSGAWLRPLTSSQGLVELVGNSVRFGVPDSDHVGVLARVARRCRCFRLEFGDLSEAHRLVMELVA